MLPNVLHVVTQVTAHRHANRERLPDSRTMTQQQTQRVEPNTHRCGDTPHLPNTEATAHTKVPHDTVSCLQQKQRALPRGRRAES